MKILWFCNTVIPSVGKQIGLSYLKPESWITGMYEQLRLRDDMELVYVFPYTKSGRCYAEQQAVFVGYDRAASDREKQFVDILMEYKPDVIHLFGTESPDVLQMVSAAKKCDLQEKVVISIQGLLSAIARHYCAHLPYKVIHAYTLRDFLKHDNIYWQMKKFEKRGAREVEAIRSVFHVIGRTDWDRACAERMNPNIHYHFCNESLRPLFYENRWELDKCERHSIFVSQSNYPLKGFHLMLEAMADIVKVYPDAHLYTTGQDPLTTSFKQKIKQTYYLRYLRKLIKAYNLEKHVTFMGTLDEKQMCDRFLRSHVFVCCSSIENSPNSVGEAMMLGVPTVSSDVGGVKNMLEHGKEGYVYQSDAPYMAAYYVKKLFQDDATVLAFSGKARDHAKLLHDRAVNIASLLEIYEKVGGRA